MRDYGKVYSRIWESADFRALSEDGRTLVMYLLTCQHGTIAGVFRVPDGYACEDLQWDSARVAQGFANLSDKGFATRCDATKWVWVTKYLEWNKPENPNQRKSAAKIALSVPDQCTWKRVFMRVCGPLLGLDPLPDENPLETVSQQFINQEQEQEKEQKQEQEQKQEGDSAAQTGDQAHREQHGATTLPTMAAAVCVALKSCGVGDVNPGQLDLLRLLNAGVEIGAFVAAARSSKVKRFTYVLGIVKNQHDKAQQIAGKAAADGPRSGETPRERRQRERYEEMTGGKPAPDTIDMDHTSTGALQ